MANSVAHLYHKYVGRKAMLTVCDYPEQKDHKTNERRPPSPGMEIPVFCLDARFAWGRAELLVTPPRGQGSTWVRSDNKKLRLVEEWPDEQDPATALEPDAALDAD